MHTHTPVLIGAYACCANVVMYTHMHTQAQQGVTRKEFTTLEDLVAYYSNSRRGLVCGLTKPIAQLSQDDEQDQDESGE